MPGSTLDPRCGREDQKWRFRSLFLCQTSTMTSKIALSLDGDASEALPTVLLTTRGAIGLRLTL